MDRYRAASAAVGDTMVVLGGRNLSDGSDIFNFEVYDTENDVWEQRPEWEMKTGRSR